MKDAVYMSVMEHLDRHSAKGQVAFNAVLYAAIPTFDATLMLHFGRLSAKGVSWDKWLDGHNKLAGFVMNSEDIDIVLDARGDVSVAAAHLARLFASSKTGEVVFRLPLDQIGSKCVSLEFKRQIADVKAANFSADSLRTMMAVTDAKLKQFYKHRTTAKRETTLTFFGMNVTKTEAPPEAEREMLLSVAVKEAAISKEGGLPALPYEKLMFPQLATVLGQCEVPEALIKGPRAARELVLQVLEKKGARSYDGVLLALRPIGVR